MWNRARHFAVTAGLVGSVVCGSVVRAEAQPLSYIEILRSLTSNQPHIITEVPALAALNQARTLEEARQIMSRQQVTREALAETQKYPYLGDQKIIDMAKKAPLTFVVVPGVLGEFIDGRAFEEIFERESNYKHEWQQLADRARANDMRFNLSAFAEERYPMSELINAASVEDEQGNTIYKIVILKTPFGSLESVGKNPDKAAIFNRRLQKYYELTGDQNLVLLGYSRGTQLALEMIVQAQRENLSYLTSVKNVVSYAGVIMGSALADVTEDETSESGRLLVAARKLMNDLQYSTSLLDRMDKRKQNAEAFGKFLDALMGGSQELNHEEMLTTARSGDFKTAAALIAKIGTELGLRSLMDFNGHVDRLKALIQEVLYAVDGLKSQSMQTWWQNNTLPRNIRYLSLTASMVDPDKNELEKAIFNSQNGYNDSLDDKSLLGNKRTYEKTSGVAMNDSQVAVHQSLFLPSLIAQLNSKNAGLHIEALGVMQTHHWGAALRSVNKMRDGRLNPYPREKVLMALAAYINQ